MSQFSSTPHTAVAKSQSAKTPVAVVGARGYSGLQLCRILLTHPHFELTQVYATETDWTLSQYLPEPAARAIPVRALAELEKASADVGLVFLATPAEASEKIAPILLQKNPRLKVIDLSNAFRLGEEAHFGLVPWLCPTSDTRLVANPGCYATSVFLALLPLLKNRLIAPDSIVIDAKSGATGAGRKAAENLLFTEVAEECMPYRVARHQHLPEIVHHVEKITGARIRPFFSTHLLPTRRGILSSLYARLENGKGVTDVARAFSDAYTTYPLVRTEALRDEKGSEKSWNMSMKRVNGSPLTLLSFHVENDQLYVFSVLDNLMKGAASQAIENANLCFGFKAETGLALNAGTL